MSVVMDRVMPRQKITVEEYYRMAEDGRLAPDARVELIEGEIIDMAPMGTLHAARVSYITRVLTTTLDPRVSVRGQCPLRLSSFSELMPDFVIVTAREDDYEYKHPNPADVLLVIEVSDSSLKEDKADKVPLYARFGIPEVWIVDVRNSRLEIYRNPVDRSYTEVVTMKEATPLTLALLPDTQINLPKLFEA
jgi:Uma2 family endonuclease